MIASLPNLMPEGWVALALLIALAFFGLSRFIEEMFDEARALKREEQETRKMLRENMNQLLCEMAQEDDPESLEMLKRAFEDCVGMYRGMFATNRII